MDRDDIIRMAREAEIPGSWDLNWFDPYLDSFAALVAAHGREKPVAQPDQEPVAWMYVNLEGECEQIEYEAPPNDPSVTPLYTAPRPWVGLTDEDFQPAVQKTMVYYGYKPEHSTLTSGAGFYELVRAIEAKLKEKNT